MILKKVIIFKNHLNVEVIRYTNPVPVTLNFDNSREVGFAELTHDDETGITYADITVTEFENVQIPPVWPAVGGHLDKTQSFKIETVALCSNPNVDPTIEPIQIGFVPKTKKFRAKKGDGK